MRSCESGCYRNRSALPQPKAVSARTDSLQRQLSTPGSRGRPWNPPLCGELDIRIARDGSWWHEGQKIWRHRLIRLFASVLRRETDGCHYLVTPVEKWRIAVDDVAFLAVAVERDGERLKFRNNVGEDFVAGAQYPLRIELAPDSDEPRPYLSLDNGLEARLVPGVFYQLIEWAESEPGEGLERHFFIRSGDQRFELGAADC